MKIITKIFIVFLMATSSSFAQNQVLDKMKNDIDSLKKVPSSLKRDTTLAKKVIDFLYTVGIFNLKENYKTNLDLAYQLSHQHDWQRGIGHCKTLDGDLQNVLGNHEKAMILFEEALTIFEKLKAKKSAAYLHYEIGSAVMNFTSISSGYTHNPLIIKALEHLEASQNFYREVQDSVNLAKNYIYINSAYTRIKQFDKGLPYLDSCHKILLKKNIPAYEAMYEGSMAMYFFERKDEKKALDFMEKAMVISNKLGDIYLPSVMFASLGDFYSKKGDFSKAILNAEKGLEISKKLNIPELIYRCQHNLYEIYKRANDPAKALKYYEFSQKLEDSLNRKKVNFAFSEFNSKYELPQKELKIKTLENEKLQSEANRQSWIRNLLIISLLAGIGFAFYIFRNYNLLKIKNKAIENALLEGQTTERKRMASELHDNVSNKILALKMRMETLENEHFTEKEKQYYDATIRYVDEVYADVRLVSHNLLPEELEQKGLMAAIESLVRKVNLINRTHFDLDIGAIQKRFSLRFEYEIYITILELVNNVLKHAQAKNAIIAIFEENNLLKLAIKDDGRGIENKVNFDSLGIKSIRSRIESLKGKIAVLTNNGTSVEIEVPYNPYP